MSKTHARKKIRIALLGATGSIGESTRKVVDAHLDLFELYAVTAHTQRKKLEDIACRYGCHVVGLTSTEAPALTGPFEFFQGEDALAQIAALREVDVVVLATVGFSALKPCASAIAAGKKIACANKEALVCAGDLLMPKLAPNQLIPVDSEHSAIFQCLVGEEQNTVKTLWLTCSGGPFLHASKDTLSRATARDALKHPSWSMGDKITIDSATLMNKGLEVIEAHHLFGASYDAIKVLIHPESVVHSMVAFEDGSVKAQAAAPTMTLPIQYALTYPKRLASPAPMLDFYNISELHFEAPNMQTFPLLKLAYEMGREGGTAPCIMNGANEVANEAFRKGLITFMQVYDVISATCDALQSEPVTSLDQLEVVDAAARACAHKIIKEL